jgi:hypothetical protein
MSRKSLAAVLVVAGIVAAPFRAEAGCFCAVQSYQGGFVVGYGATCTDASTNLASGARLEAQQDCLNMDFADGCAVSYTASACTFDTVENEWKMSANSISFHCLVCRQ